VSPLRRLLDRFSRSEAELQAEQLREQSSRAGCQTMDRVRLRELVRLRGTVVVVTLNPRGVNRWLEAVLSDGSGEVTLVWMGRRVLRGVEAGAVLEVEGRLTLSEGRRTIFNPKYRLMPR